MRSPLTPASLLPGRYLAAILAFGVLLAGCGGGDNGDPVDVPDTQPPTVTVTAPIAGPVSLVIPVTAAAFDNRGVVAVQFFLDDVALGAELTATPYAITWDTRTATNGPHVLTATARDAAGYVGTSPPVTVNVSGGI